MLAMASHSAVQQCPLFWQDRLTFSAIFEMTPEAVVVNTTFAKASP